MGPLPSIGIGSCSLFLQTDLNIFMKITLSSLGTIVRLGTQNGASDGVGAVCKRTGDRMVALGEDLVDIKKITNGSRRKLSQH